MNEAMDPNTHLEYILARLPKSTDPDEARIVGVIQEELLNTPWSKQFFNDAREKMLGFFKFALDNPQDPKAIHLKNQELLKELARMGHAKIVSGQENLQSLEKGKPFLLVANHLGDYKLTPLLPKELGIDVPMDQIHPFPIYYAPYHPIAEHLSNNLFDAHVELPQPLFDVEEACGLVTIVAAYPGGLERLEKATKSLFEKRPNSILVVFPEGGTTGKRNNGGPYDLEEFHAGAFVIASHLGVPILPVARYFDPEDGYKLGVLSPINLEATDDKNYYKEVAKSTQDNLQTWLDSQK